MSSVCPSTEARRMVNLNMLYYKAIDIESFVIGITLCIFQKLQQKFCRLLGPATLRSAKLFGLSAPADATVEPTERYALLVLDDVLQVLLRSPQGHTFDSTRRLMGVLEVHAQIGAARFARLGLVDRLVGVTTHCVLKAQTDRSQIPSGPHRDGERVTAAGGDPIRPASCRVSLAILAAVLASGRDILRVHVAA